MTNPALCTDKLVSQFAVRSGSPCNDTSVKIVGSAFAAFIVFLVQHGRASSKYFGECHLFVAITFVVLQRRTSVKGGAHK